MPGQHPMDKTFVRSKDINQSTGIHYTDQSVPQYIKRNRISCEPEGGKYRQRAEGYPGRDGARTGERAAQKNPGRRTIFRNRDEGAQGKSIGPEKRESIYWPSGPETVEWRDLSKWEPQRSEPGVKIYLTGPPVSAMIDSWMLRLQALLEKQSPTFRHPITVWLTWLRSAGLAGLHAPLAAALK